MHSHNSELLRALAVFAEPPSLEHHNLAVLLDLPATPTATAYTSVFVFDLYPYASVYLGPEGMLGGEARDRVAGFFRALGATPPAEPDHLSTLLAAYADAVDVAPDDAVGRRVRQALLWEHLLSWLVAYLPAVAENTQPYQSWAALLLEVLTAEADALGWPGPLPLHLRTAPGIADPRVDGSKAYVDSLLTPVRSGLIVTSKTLAQAAADLGLGLRIAERRFVLRQLFDQDVSATLAWLADHADRQAARLPTNDVLAPLRDFWAQRLGRTAELLRSLAADVAADRQAAVAPR